MIEIIYRYKQIKCNKNKKTKQKQTILIYMFKDRGNKSLCQEIQNLNQIKTFKIQVLPRILFLNLLFSDWSFILIF